MPPFTKNYGKQIMIERDYTRKPKLLLLISVLALVASTLTI